MFRIHGIKTGDVVRVHLSKSYNTNDNFGEMKTATLPSSSLELSASSVVQSFPSSSLTIVSPQELRRRILADLNHLEFALSNPNSTDAVNTVVSLAHLVQTQIDVRTELKMFSEEISRRIIKLIQAIDSIDSIESIKLIQFTKSVKVSAALDELLFHLLNAAALPWSPWKINGRDRLSLMLTTYTVDSNLDQCRKREQEFIICGALDHLSADDIVLGINSIVGAAYEPTRFRRITWEYLTSQLDKLGQLKKQLLNSETVTKLWRPQTGEVLEVLEQWIALSNTNIPLVSSTNHEHKNDNDDNDNDKQYCYNVLKEFETLVTRAVNSKKIVEPWATAARLLLLSQPCYQ